MLVLRSKRVPASALLRLGRWSTERTAAVMLTILHVMAGRARAIGDRDRPSPAADRRLEGRPQAHTKPVTVL
jgi:hypothetical protein